MYRKAVRNFNAKYPRGQQPYGARQVGQGGVAAGNNNPNPGSNYLEGPHRKTIFELLALANVPKGSCILCP
jgi:hypothetical protein